MAPQPASVVQHPPLGIHPIRIHIHAYTQTLRLRNIYMRTIREIETQIMHPKKKRDRGKHTRITQTGREIHAYMHTHTNRMIERQSYTKKRGAKEKAE